jgi:serine/threonine protein kinase
MDETKNVSETDASLSPAEASNRSSDETRSLSGTAGSQPPIESSSGSPDGDPSRIRRYRIIHRLGQDGFGRVYLAHDDDLDRPVAIKVPNPERIAQPEDVEAFLTEARILAKLDHPHIVPVFDVGRTEDGLCFVVSKLVEGSDLAVKMDQARPPRQIDDTIPRELERICLKAMSKRASERYTTARESGCLVLRSRPSTGARSSGSPP